MKNSRECIYKDCMHFEACNAWIRHGTTLYDDFNYSVENCPYFEDKTEQVKHGEWIECFEDWRQQIAGDECSHCGFQHYGSSINHYYYCPNCGAKMDKEEDNNE